MELGFPVILDGATGTELQKLGYDGNDCAERWVLEHPDAIRQVHNQYIEAGSRIVYAPTFQANRVKLEENGIFNQVKEYNSRLVGLVKENAGRRAYVAGDIAPTGRFLAPLGDTSFDDMYETFREMVEGMEEAGVDLYAVETQMSVPEARAAVLAIRSLSEKPVIVTFTCDENGRTLSGSDIAAVLQIMQGMEIDVFGLNCSVGPKDMLQQLKHLRKYAQVPLAAKPNAGLPKQVDGKTVYETTPDELAACAADFAEAGVCFFGGCCGSTPEHIHQLAEALKDVKMLRPEPEHPELLPLATEKKVFLLPKDVKCTCIFDCDEELADNLEDEDSASPVIGIRIQREEELDIFQDNQYAISKPLCLFCEDEKILEEALRLYQGRAMYEGSLDEEVLKRLSRKYGLIY